MTIDPPARFQHRRDLRLHAEIDALDHDLEDVLDGGHVLLRQQRLGAFDAGIVVGEVQPAEIAHGALHQRSDLILLGDVGGHEGRPAAAVADLGGDRLAAGLVDIGDQDRRALGGQRQRRRAADA